MKQRPLAFSNKEKMDASYYWVHVFGCGITGKNVWAEIRKRDSEITEWKEIKEDVSHAYDLCIEAMKGRNWVWVTEEDSQIISMNIYAT